MVASLSWPSRCMFLRYCLPSRAHARNSPFSRLLFCCCIGCLLSGRRGSLVFVRYASRFSRWSLLPGSQEVSRLSASPFRCRRRNGRRFRLLPGLLTGERPRVGAFGPNSATIRYRHCGQALLEGAQRYLFCSRMASLQRRPCVRTGSEAAQPVSETG